MYVPTPLPPRRARASSGARRRAGRAVVAAAILAVLAALLPATGAEATTPVPRRIVSGWMPYWSTSASLASYTANSDLFGEVSPFWYSLTWSTADGSGISASLGSGSRASALVALRDAHATIVPTVTDSMPTHQLAAVLTTPALRGRLVAQLTSLADVTGYDGLDLDLEKFAFADGSASWAATRPGWVAFVHQLAASLHARHKMLAVTTPPLYNTARDSTSGYWVYDWAGIGTAVDRLRVMAYDYSVSRPGPIAPLPWVSSVMAFATTQLAAAKVELGVPNYGRDWVTRTPSGGPDITGACPVDNPPDLGTHAFPASTLLSVLAARGLTSKNLHWDATDAEHTVTYARTFAGHDGLGAPTSCRVSRTIWVDAASSVVARARLVGAYHLRGITMWTVGGEDPGVWGALRTYARSLAPVATAVRVTAPSAVTYGGTAVVRALVTATGRPVVGVAATLTWTAPSGARRALGTTLTGVGGIATFTARVTGSGTFSVAAAADWARYAGSGRAAPTAVRPHVLVSSPAGPVHVGVPAHLVVSVLPIRPGQWVLRQHLVGGVWVTTGSARVPKSGRVGFTVTPSHRGTSYAYRFVVPAHAGLLTGTSRTVVVAAS